MQPYLDAWRHTRSETALRHLLIFIRYYLMDERAEKRRSGWWGGPKRQRQQIITWIPDPATTVWIQQVWERNHSALERQETVSSLLRIRDGVLGWLASQVVN